MDSTQTSLIQWQCQQLLNRVVTFTDNRQWDELASCYSEDAVMFRPSDAQNPISGRDEIKAAFYARPPGTTCHLLTNCVFTIIDKTSVTATSRVLLLSGAASTELPIGASSKIMTGKFSDTLTLVDDEWLIERREGSIDLRYDYSVTS